MKYVAAPRGARMLRAWLLGTAAALSTFGAAQAQEQAAEDDIIVTAPFQNSLINRLPIEPEELPFSLSIVDGETLRERGYFNPLDVLETVPNVVRRNTQYLPTGGSYVIRGLYGTVLTNNRPENDSRGAGRRDASQIERFEVLKGPVSVLLGPVIPGGVINQATKSPEDEDFVELIARLGSYDTYRFEGDFNEGALLGSDIWSGRLTVAFEDQGSPQELANVETFSVRPVVEANFSERTPAQASVSYTERTAVPTSSFAVNPDGSIPRTIDAETYFGLASEHVGEDVYVDVEVQHEFLDDLKLVVRGSYQDTDFEYQTAQNGYNYAGTGGSVAYVYYSAGYRNTNVSYGDVQLVGGFEAFGQRHDWVIGTSYQETSFASYWAFGGVLGVVDVNNIGGAVYGTPDFDLPLAPYRDVEDQLFSVYAETNIRPTDRLTIVAGVRYDEYEQTNLVSDVTTPSDDTTFRLGGTYELTDGLNAYVSYAEGFVPQNGTTRSGSAIEPETAVNYEAGLKGSLLDGRLRLTAAVFALTRENVATTDPANMPGDPPYVIATGEQEHNGFELAASFALTPAIDVELAYGYVEAEVTKVISPGTGEDVGDPVALVPNHTFSAFGTYTIQNGPLADLRFGLGVRGISERPAPRFGLEYDGYTLVDALVSYPVSERFDLQLNIHNLLDEEYRETPGYSTGTPNGGHRFGNPLSAYITARARF